jgi:hypothetical protein
MKMNKEVNRGRFVTIPRAFEIAGGVGQGAGKSTRAAQGGVGLFFVRTCFGLPLGCGV